MRRKTRRRQLDTEHRDPSQDTEYSKGEPRDTIRHKNRKLMSVITTPTQWPLPSEKCLGRHWIEHWETDAQRRDANTVANTKRKTASRRHSTESCKTEPQRRDNYRVPDTIAVQSDQ